VQTWQGHSAGARNQPGLIWVLQRWQGNVNNNKYFLNLIFWFLESYCTLCRLNRSVIGTVEYQFTYKRSLDFLRVMVFCELWLDSRKIITVRVLPLQNAFVNNIYFPYTVWVLKHRFLVCMTSSSPSAVEVFSMLHIF
jgi:hypothetical protein